MGLQYAKVKLLAATDKERFDYCLFAQTKRRGLYVALIFIMYSKTEMDERRWPLVVAKHKTWKSIGGRESYSSILGLFSEVL